MRHLAAGVAALTICLSSVAEKLPKTGLKKNHRAAWHAVMKWPVDCEDAFAVRGDDSAGLQFYSLGAGKSLVAVACAPGAYQGSQIYYLLDESGSTAAAKALEFPTWDASGPDGTRLERRRTTELTGSAQYKPAARELHVLNRYRGPGDCGSFAVYLIGNGGVELKKFRAKVQCDGRGAEHPERWPLVYPAKATPGKAKPSRSSGSAPRTYRPR